MTDFPIRPGCFGSALFYSVNAPECQSCALADACSGRFAERRSSVLSLVVRMDALFSLESAPQVAKWFSDRLTRNVAKDRSSKLKTDFLEKLSADGVNVYHLRHGSNPVETPGSILHDLFAFLIEVGPFKPRDAVEHLRPIHPSESKASLERLVKEVCEALVHASVLKKEKHVLCLNPN